MIPAHTLLLLALSALAVGYTVDPPTTASPDTIEDCTNWITATSSDTCPAIASDYALTLAQLYRYNPSLEASCSIVVGQSYCVEENWGIPPVETTSSTVSSTKTTSSISSTATGNGISTPTPTQPGMVSNCNKFYYVATGQSCNDVLAANNIDLATLYAYNTGVGETCSGLWAEVYVCVGVIGASTSSSSVSTTTTSAGNGVSTPTPTQPGMVSNCNKFYYVSSGQSCSDVLAANNIDLATLYAYNTGVGETCSGLWADVYVCVGIIGGTVTSTTSTSQSLSTTATSSGNGISTPTPTQPGMVSNCDKFDFVASGESCSTILTRNGITVADLYALNSGVGSDCSGLWASVYVCVHAIGGPTSTSSPTSTTFSTTTTSGNGIATPTPTMPGMVTNCKTFYKVVSGDTCAVISTKTGATVANIIAWNTQVGSDCNVWLDYYICVGV